MKPEKPPLVSACIITYNQETYISDCIKNALNQKVNFTYEIVIGDDHSTDRTAEICQAFADEFPGRIRLIKRPANLGILENWKQTIQACQGKYVALCEGDDYWTSTCKLQEQVSFLENNSDFALSFHDASIINERDPLNTIDKYSGYDWNFIDAKRDVYDIADLLQATLCPSASVVFRRPDNFTFPGWYVTLPFADMSLFILVTGEKKIKFFNEAWSVYRRHGSSASAAPLMNHVFIRGKISMYLHLYDSLPAKQQQGLTGIIKSYASQLPDIMYLEKSERMMLKKLMPRFYLRQLAGYYKRSIKNGRKKSRHSFKN